MKMKIKFGNIKYNYEGEISEFYNTMADMFTKCNLDFMNKMYENLPPNLMNYYKDINKIFEEYMHMYKPNFGSNPDNPDILPANGHDIYNYVARYGLTNYQIQAILTLDGHIDFEKLSRAVRLSIDSQPILGCRFIENEPPYWKRLDNIDKIEFCSMEDTENPETAVSSFLENPINMDYDPMIKVKLIRSEQYDIICIKNNHACCDGSGTKEYIQLLSEIYSIIDQDNGIFITKPVKRSRKDQDRLFSKLGIPDPRKEWISGSEITKATWPFPWKLEHSDITHNVICRLPAELLDEMSLYSKAKNVTINDLFLTAYYRAMAAMEPPVYDEPMEISVTVDLRRYLPDHKTEAIRNFSGSEFARLSLVPNESFSETLYRVAPMMNEIKNNRPGLQSAIGLERIEKLTFSETLAYYKVVSQWPYSCTDKCAPVLSNLGFLSNSLLKFGKKIVTDAYILPPVVREPGLLLMVSTYNGIITLASGYYEASIPREYIDTLLNKIKAELIEGCQL